MADLTDQDFKAMSDQQLDDYLEKLREERKHLAPNRVKAQKTPAGSAKKLRTPRTDNAIEVELD